MEVRPLRPDDADTLLAFFACVPEHERTFFKEEVLDRGTIEGWLCDERGRRAIACEDGAVAGYVAVVPLVGWSDHVGEVRLVVDPDRRRAGVGRELARWALVQAVEAGHVGLVASRTAAKVTLPRIADWIAAHSDRVEG